MDYIKTDFEQAQYDRVVEQNRSLQEEIICYRNALHKIIELNSDCADCKGECTYCSTGTNKETYEISKTILLSEVEI